MTITDSSEWLKNNQENKKACVPLNTHLTEHDCQMTKAKYKQMLKNGFIEDPIRAKKLFFCGNICSGMNTLDSKKKIGEKRVDQMASNNQT